MAPRKRPRRPRPTKAKPAPAQTVEVSLATGPPSPLARLKHPDELLPFEREVFDRAVARLVLAGCPEDAAVMMAWNAGDWEPQAVRILTAVRVDVNPHKQSVLLRTPPVN